MIKFMVLHRGKRVKGLYKHIIKEGDRVLDIGCGNGIITNEIRKHFKCNIIGTDIYTNKELIKIPFKEMETTTKLPFKDKEFDISIIDGVLHHCENKSVQVEILKEAKRVSNKILIIEGKPTVRNKILDIIFNKINNPDISVPLNFRYEDEWLDLFKRLDLDLVKKKRIRMTLYFSEVYFFYLKEVNMEKGIVNCKG